jgi:hypothetical protein
MRKLFRYSRIAFSAICVIACALMIVLWVRSFMVGPTIASGLLSSSTTFRIDSVLGHVQLYLGTVEPGVNDDPFELSTIPWEYSDRSSWTTESKFGFRYFPDDKEVILPHWALLIFFAALGLAPWIKLPRRFSLRMLFISSAIIAAMLGCAVYIVENYFERF